MVILRPDDRRNHQRLFRVLNSEFGVGPGSCCSGVQGLLQYDRR